MYNMKKEVFENTGLCRYSFYEVPINVKRDVVSIRNDFKKVPDTKPKKRVQKTESIDIETGELIDLTLDDRYKRQRSIKNSINRTKKNIYNKALSEKWDYFLTLTFADEDIRNNYDNAVKALKVWIDKTRRNNKETKYIIVPEKHKKGGWHFHALFKGNLNLVKAYKHTKKNQFAVDSNGSAILLKTKNNQQIYNINDYKIGFTTATKIDDTIKVSQYLLKYITKELVEVTFNKKRYFASRNINKVKEFINIVNNSKMLDYMKNVIELHKDDVNYYISNIKVNYDFFKNDITYILCNIS